MLAVLLTLVLGGATADSKPRQMQTPRQVKMIVTGYCPCKSCCGPNAKGITASGKKVKKGMAAAPKKYKFGTKLYVPGYGNAVVEDRGGAIKAKGEKYKGKVMTHDRLDLFFPTHQEALNWGKRTVTVTVK